MLPVGDDIPGLEQRIASLNLRIFLAGLEADESAEVSVKVNGTDVAVTPEKESWLAGEVPPAAMKHGDNTVSVAFESGSAQSLQLASVELAVKYKQ